MKRDLLAVLKEARETLQFANDALGGPISDTIWMMHRPETLFDFLDAAIAAADPEEAWDDIDLAEMIMSDCGISCDYVPLKDRIAKRIAAHVVAKTQRLLEAQGGTTESTAQPSPLLDALGKRCYMLSGTHLSGARVIIGFENLDDAHEAHGQIMRVPSTEIESAKVED